MDENDQLVRKLDEDFKLGLVFIRPHILRLTSVEDARLCRLWLDKLHLSVEERELRNELLKELNEQIKSGCLKHPFKNPPNEYPLSFQVENEAGYSKVDLHDEVSTLFSSQEVARDNVTFSICPSSDESEFPIPKKVQGRIKSEPFNTSKWRGNKSEPKQLCEGDQNTCEAKEEQVQSFLSTIASLRAQNEALKHEVELYQKNSTIAQKNLNHVNDELLSLRARLGELQRINSNIEKSHVKAANEYRKALSDSLCAITEKLKEVSEQKVDLVNILTSIESKIHHEQQHENDSERKLKKVIEELKLQLETQKKKNGIQIHHLEAIIQQKDEQLKKVDSQVKKRCSRMQEEVCHIKSEMDQVTSEGHLQLKAKVSSLKKDVAQLEKANKKLVAEYESRLKACKKECKKRGNKDLDSIEKAVEILEQKYRKIVSDMESKAADQRQKDAQRIRELEEQLQRQKMK